MHRLIIGADGRAGAHGRHGFRGADGSFSGSDGGDGGAAGWAELGQPGGEVVAQLREADAGGYAVDYRLALADAREAKAEVLALGLDVLVLARGGRGGDGGCGGAGGQGARGRRGSDATRYSSGGRGGPGGDGGDGGRGSDGAAGGGGGTIEVLVDEAQAYLLMAVQSCEAPAVLVAGGEGGVAGRHGRGGSGGSGGPGGSSYSWTETESYTDSEGNRQTRTTFHSNPGGSRGPSGSSGRSPANPLHAGVEGAAGQFRIAVSRGDAWLRYDRRYDLVLDSFAFAESDMPTRDGILEFGEVVEVSQLCLRNVGGMPTPPNQRIRLTLREQTWLLPCDDEQFIARSLAVGESIVIPGKLRFRIAMPGEVEPGDPLVVEEHILPAADQLGPQGTAETAFVRRYAQVCTGRSFEARYPVENGEGVRVLRSLAPGERSRLVFPVANISKLDIGEASAGKRRLRVQLEHIGGDATTEQLVYIDEAGEAHPLRHDEGVGAAGQARGPSAGSASGYFVDIPCIRAGDQFVLGGEVGFLRDTPAYVSAELCFTIWLETLELDGVSIPIQRRVVSIRAEPAYHASPWSQAVLVTHNQVERETYLAWNELLESELELQTDEWSMARYGHFDHSAETPTGTVLGEDLRDKLVIVLNEPFNPFSTEIEALPTDFVRGEDFRRSVTEGRTRYLVVGSDAFALGRWLEPTSRERSGGVDYEGLRSFRASLPAEAETQHEDRGGVDITTTYDRVRVYTWRWPWGQPHPTLLEQRARELQAILARRHPHCRYLVIHRGGDEPSIWRTGLFGLLVQWHIGELEIRRSLNLETSAAVLVRADPTEMDDPAFVGGEVMRYALLLAMPFAAKLDRLNWLMHVWEPLDEDRRLTGKWLARAILADLAEEQWALRRARGHLDPGLLERRLSYLVTVREFPLAPPTDGDPAKWAVLLDLCADLELLGEIGRGRFQVFGRQATITRFVRDCVDRFANHAFADYQGEDGEGYARARPELDERIRLRTLEIVGDLGWFHRALRTQLMRARVELFFQQPPPVSKTIEREVDVWRNPAKRVWHEATLDAAQSRERLRLATKSRWAEVHSEDRGEMLVEQSESDS